jgi:hypothetical protein
MTPASDSMLWETLDRLAAEAGEAEGVVRHVSARPTHLKPGRALVIVLEGKAVAMRTIERGEAPADPTEVFARELATLGAVLGETLQIASAPAGLTAEELAVLEEGGMTVPAEQPAPADDPVRQSVLAYARLVEGSLSVERAAKLLRVDPSRVRQRLGGPAPSLYGFKFRGTWHLPAEQFDGRAALPGLAEVVPAIPRDLHPLEVVQWLTLPNPDLTPGEEGEHLSPRDWLRTGHPPAAVVDRARELDHES